MHTHAHLSSLRTVFRNASAGILLGDPQDCISEARHTAAMGYTRSTRDTNAAVNHIDQGLQPSYKLARGALC